WKKRCRNCARATGSRPSSVSTNKSKYASFGRIGAGTGAPELGVTGVDLTSRFPRGERGENNTRSDGEQAEYHRKHEGRPQKQLSRLAGSTIAQKASEAAGKLKPARWFQNRTKGKFRKGDAETRAQRCAARPPTPGA